MLVDLEEKLEGPGEPYKTTICIAGAGIAGLVLACDLADAGIDVLLLEAGGQTLEPRSQQIYEAEMVGREHVGTTAGRFRVFGGSSTRWGGQLLPYTEDILTPTPGSLSEGWPITLRALEPYYQKAEILLGADHLPYSTELYEALRVKPRTVLSSDSGITLRFSKWTPFSNRNLARTLGKRAIRSSKITVMLHANLTECLLSPDRTRVEAFLVRNYKGTCFRVEAKQYIMATGTIETSRILLASRSVCPEGVGNEYDQVGRGFHDHLQAPIAELVGEGRRKLLAWLGPFLNKGTLHTARLEATAALRRSLNLLPIDAHLTIEEPDGSPGDEARRFLRSVQRGELKQLMLGRTARLPIAGLHLARIAYYQKLFKRRAVSKRALVRMHVTCEQCVSPQNRIQLSNKSCDTLAIPKAVIDWRVGPAEGQTIKSYARHIREQLSRIIGSPIAWYMDTAGEKSSNFPYIRDTNHPMGGTIMGVNRKTSVVDPNLRMHGISNLFVSSCSTYPSGGSSNPTFTLIALALRLADHMKRVVRKEGTVIALETA